MDAGAGRRVGGDKLSPNKIELRKMAQQAEVRTSEDDWTGVRDAAERRKLQNRLNQRIYRCRRGAKPKLPPQPGNSKVDAALQAIVQSEQSQKPPEKEVTTPSHPSTQSKLITSASAALPTENFQPMRSNRHISSRPSSTTPPLTSDASSTTSEYTPQHFIPKQ
ncbi:hypothetical protein BDZ45DRAFT_286085 [Acephala macrosclerotiorum]|nr:hypothetical protein BDZ45DRAFT_286085 [Acephala macrosclerotiorum]